MHPSPTRAQVYQMDDLCYHNGGGVTQIDIKIKDHMCGISRSPTQDTSGTSYKWYLQVVLFQQSSDVHKNARFKPQPSTPNAYLCINEKHIFMEIDDKGGEIVQRYESFEIEIVQGGEIRYKSSKK